MLYQYQKKSVDISVLGEKDLEVPIFFRKKIFFGGVAISLDFTMDIGNITLYMVPCTHRDG